MTLGELVARINEMYPRRDWDQWCQRLMWNCVYVLMGYEHDSEVADQGSATIARLNSVIESTNASAAPAGAMHWFLYPSDGHVGMSLGGSKVLMTGTPQALGKGSHQLGTNYGVTTVEAYSKAKGNPYLGWSRTNGRNPSLIGKLDMGGSSGGTKVKHYVRQDPSARGGGRTLAPGRSLYLHTTKGAADGLASNVVGGVGPYSITPHVYAEGVAGEAVEVALIWQDTKAKPVFNSSHYVERLVFDKDGVVRASREFKRAVPSGYAVYVKVTALESNTGPVKITLLDCDSYLFV